MSIHSIATIHHAYLWKLPCTNMLYSFENCSIMRSLNSVLSDLWFSYSVGTTASNLGYESLMADTSSNLGYVAHASVTKPLGIKNLVVVCST